MARYVSALWLSVGFIGVTYLSVMADGQQRLTSLPSTTSGLATTPHAAGARESIARTLLSVPLPFEPNLGQAAVETQYLARATGYTLQVRRDGAHMELADSGVRHSLTMRMVGARLEGDVEAQDPQPGRSNYLIGDSSQHRRDIPHFGRVVARDIYRGIDLVYYGRQGAVEYDFVVSPGADPSPIALRFQGHDSMTVDADGDLVFRWSSRELRQNKPVIYQLPGRTPVNGSFAINADGTVGFQIDAWDRTRTLVIDPTLAVATYLGGSGTDLAKGVATDSNGNIYIGGSTESLNFPVSGGTYQGTHGSSGLTDTFVTKINAAGTAILYSTYLGGTNRDDGRAIAVDSAGSAYVVGDTASPNFPHTSAVSTTCSSGDGFLVKLNPAGNGLSYSMCMGTGGTDIANAVSVDSSLRAYVTGLNGATDAFVARVNAAGSAFDYFKVVGGSSYDEGFGIAADASGAVCVAGTTYSSNFPTTNPRQAVYGGGNQDAFVVKYDASGTTVFATYLGGTGSDSGNGAGIDGSGNCYVAGQTSSATFPTQNAAQSTISSDGTDGFVTAYNAAGSAYTYSTYLGGSSSDSANAIAVSAAGVAHVGGGSYSVNFPAVNALGGHQDVGSVRVSTNAASTFSPTALSLSGISVQTLAVDPTNASRIYAGTTVGVYRSQDGGASWSPVTNALSFRNVLALAIDPNTPCTVYAGIDTGDRFFNRSDVIVRSLDCGSSWSYIGGAPLGRIVRSISISSDSTTLFLAFVYNLTTTTSQESVIRWTGGTQDYSLSTPYESTYATATGPTGCTAYAGDFSGRVLLNTTCSPTAPNWTQVGATLSGRVNTIAVHPSTADSLLAGTASGNLYRKPNSGSSWTIATTLQGGVTGIVYQPNNASVVYAATTRGSVYKSVDGGASWSPSAVIGPAIAKLAVSANSQNSVFAATSANQDGFYTRLNSAGVIVDSTLFGGHGFDNVHGIAVDPSGNAVLVGRTDTVDLPVTAGAIGATTGGGFDAFVVKFAPTVPLTAPTNLTLTRYGVNGVILNWTAAAGATSYNVKRGTTSGGETVYANVGSNAAYIPGTLGSRYFFVVSALNASSETGNSNEVSIVLTPAAARNDVDGDTRSDIMLYRPSAGYWYSRNSGSGYAIGAGNWIFQWGAPGDVPIQGDFDGDGKLDPTVFRPSTAQWFIRYSSKGYDPAQFGYFEWGGSGDTPISGDWDGDGKTDFGVYRGSNGYWYLRLSGQNYVAGAGNWIYQWGAPGDTPKLGDFDADGRTDLAIYRAGNWFIRYSSLGFDPNLYAYYAWGAGGDTPIVADFDGDGRTDIGVYRGSAGYWYLRLSSQNYTVGAGNWQFQWGAPGDEPKLGDFDGDGTIDITVYRPTAGVWFILYSSLAWNPASYGYYEWGAGGDIALPQN